MKKYLICLVISVLTTSCEYNKIKNEKLGIKDIEIFENTPAWELAKAVDDENISKIVKLVNSNPALVNYQEPVFGMTLLIRAIGTEKYNSAECLLKCGADPNIASYIGLTTLLQASSFSWNDIFAKKKTKFAKLLLDYNADPNIVYNSSEKYRKTNYISYKKSPLMFSVGPGSNIEITKLLVEHGAMINYKTEVGETAAIKALSFKDVNAAYYLIVEKKAKVNEPYYFYDISNDTLIERNRPLYPIDLLLDWVFELESDKYLKKMDIVQEFNKQGVNYYGRKKDIGEDRLYQIKTLYPNNWKNYLNKY